MSKKVGCGIHSCLNSKAAHSPPGQTSYSKIKSHPEKAWEIGDPETRIYLETAQTILYSLTYRQKRWVSSFSVSFTDFPKGSPNSLLGPAVTYNKCCCCLVTKSYLTLIDPMDCSPPGSSVCGIFQARILEWVAVPSFRGSSLSRDQTRNSCISCIDRPIIYHWATREALIIMVLT